LDPLTAMVWFVVFVVSVSTHEAAHALASWLGGDPTADRGGQVSLNPLPHMRREPFGMLAMPLLSVFWYGWPIGWASTPYDPLWERRHPRRAAWMAAAGPAANLLLGVLALAALRTGLATEIFTAPERVEFSRMVEASAPLLDGAGRFLSMMLTLNAILALFNLIPVPPLDGAAAIALLLPASVVERYREALLSGGVVSVPEILAILRRRAREEGRSLNALICSILGREVREEQRRQRMREQRPRAEALRRRIRRRVGAGTPAEDLIRQDRRR
jgi:Zn-dependent protease